MGSVISPLYWLCHDLAGGVRMVVDDLSLVLCVGSQQLCYCLTENKVVWQVTQLL